jgi:predicted TIM-barrel fold metal-dependent hydrolase
MAVVLFRVCSAHACSSSTHRFTSGQLIGRIGPGRPGGAGQAQKPYPVTKEIVLAAMNEAGVDRAILIPPSWEGDYNDLVLEAAQAHPDRFAAMGRLAVERAESRAGRCRLEKSTGDARHPAHVPHPRTSEDAV